MITIENYKNPCLSENNYNLLFDGGNCTWFFAKIYVELNMLSSLQVISVMYAPLGEYNTFSEQLYVVSKLLRQVNTKQYVVISARK